MCYFGPTYYGHPYLDGRGFFSDGHPLDNSATREDTAPAQPAKRRRARRSRA